MYLIGTQKGSKRNFAEFSFKKAVIDVEKKDENGAGENYSATRG